MVIVEIAGGLLVGGLAIIMALCGVVGLLGIVGAVRLVRCTGCGHMGVTSASVPVRSCVHCRHGWFLHPMYELRHSHVSPDHDVERVSGPQGRLVDPAHRSARGPRS